MSGYFEGEEAEDIAITEYNRGYNEAITAVKELINSHGYALYGDEGAKISALLCMVIDKIGGVEDEKSS